MMSDTESDSDAPFRCGFAAVIGRPNVGKSTLLNRILDQKLSIVTAKPQTTRNRILAVYNEDNAQIIFLDTPGLHSPRASLGRYMVEAAESAIQDADVCVTNDEREIGARLSDTELPVIALLNKIDQLGDKSKLLPCIEAAAAIPGIREVIPVSGLEGDGISRFLESLKALLPKGPRLYPEDMLSEQAERFFIAELIRESVINLTRQEVPYHSAVVIDQFVEEHKRCSIHATIHVERTSQRVIMVGKRGSMIKEIGQRARHAAEAFLGTPVYLKLHVEVSPGWTKDVKQLKKMGYE
jgi:GTP-binding protein Era